MNQTAIFTGQANCLATKMIDQHHDVLLHFAAKNPLHDFHGFFISHAHALNESAGFANFFQSIISLRATTMDHHRIHAHQFQQNHVTSKTFF